MKIVVIVSGGVVQNIVSDEPTTQEIYVRDYDTDDEAYCHSFVQVPECDPDHEVFKEMEEV
jgi:hypothetical protein